MFASTCFYLYMNKYQCGQVRAGDQVKGVNVYIHCMIKQLYGQLWRKHLSLYVKTIIQSIMEVIILLIDVTFGLLFDDFSIHAYSFISKQSFIILVQKSSLFYHTHVHKTNTL